MTTNPIPISTLFIGLHGILAVVLASIAAIERAKTRIWHGESQSDITNQADPLSHPTTWVNSIEYLTQRFFPEASPNSAVLRRKSRAHGNFSEYVAQGLLFLFALEFTHIARGWVWFLGISLLVARLAHAYGVITTYGPSIYRAIGFFGTLMVFVVGSISCLYYSFK